MEGCCFFWSPAVVREDCDSERFRFAKPMARCPAHSKHLVTLAIIFNINRTRWQNYLQGSNKVILSYFDEALQKFLEWNLAYTGSRQTFALRSGAGSLHPHPTPLWEGGWGSGSWHPLPELGFEPRSLEACPAFTLFFTPKSAWLSNWISWGFCTLSSAATE